MSGRTKFTGFDKPISEGDWTKMAAFLDGEGCIRIEKATPAQRYNPHARSPRHTLTVIMGNNDPRLAMWCRERFGGYVYCVERSNPKHRDAWIWHVNAKRAEAVVRGCLPHFTLKREQADVALAFCEISHTQLRGQVLPESLIEHREELRLKLVEMKVQKFPKIDGEKVYLPKTTTA